MTLPAFASVSDLAVRRPGGVTAGEMARAQAALVDASALIRAEVGSDWTDDAGVLLETVPAIFLSVTCSAARRAIDNPDGTKSVTLGAYTEVLADSSGDVYLTSAELRLVRKGAGLGGVFALGTTRDPDGLGLETKPVLCNTGGTVYLETDPPGDLMPWTYEVG